MDQKCRLGTTGASALEIAQGIMEAVSTDLEPARARVRAAIAAGAGADAGTAGETTAGTTAGAENALPPPSLETEYPQYPLPTALAAQLQARAAAGLSPAGSDYPRRQLIPTVAAPALALAGLDAIVGIIAAITWALSDWHTYLSATVAVLCALGFIVLTAAGVAAGYYASHDPLRLSKAQRRELDRARQWRSPRSWTGSQAAGEPRRLVEVAIDAAEQAAATAIWSSTYLDQQAIRIDLAAEIDAIDEQAYALAALDEQRGANLGSPEQLSARAQSWATLVDQCAALVQYAQELAALG
jgi:hypothetical protein